MDIDARRFQLGQEIRRQRQLQNLTLAQLGEMAGSNYTYVWELEKGKKSPTVDTLCRIADALGMDVRDLLTF